MVVRGTKVLTTSGVLLVFVRNPVLVNKYCFYSNYTVLNFFRHFIVFPIYQFPVLSSFLKHQNVVRYAQSPQRKGKISEEKKEKKKKSQKRMLNGHVYMKDEFMPGQFFSSHNVHGYFSGLKIWNEK